MVVDVALLLVAGTVAAIGFPTAADSRFADRLLTAIGARTTGGTVSCTIPGDLPVGRRFQCHGVDAVGGYTVEVTIVDDRKDFTLVVARPI